MGNHGPGGGKKVTQIDQEFRAWGLAQPTVGGCLFCPDFRPTGTGIEVKEACETHRMAEHPELANKRRRRRPHTNPAILVFRQNLTEEESAEIDASRRRRMRLLGIDET